VKLLDSLALAHRLLGLLALQLAVTASWTGLPAVVVD
jgi:hypothetical protein